LGALKTIMSIEKYLGRRRVSRWNAIHPRGQRKVETFKSREVDAGYIETVRTAIGTFARPILERLISRAMDSARGRDNYVAA